MNLEKITIKNFRSTMPSSARKVLPNVQEPKRQPTRSILVFFVGLSVARLCRLP